MFSRLGHMLHMRMSGMLRLLPLGRSGGFHHRAASSVAGTTSTASHGIPLNQLFSVPNLLRVGVAVGVVTGVSYSQRERLSDVARLCRTLWTVALAIADYKFQLRNLEKGTPAYDLVRSRVHVRTAEQFVKLARKNGGMFVKMGQYLSSLAHALPPEFTKTLSILQDKVPHVPFDEIRVVFEETVGPIEEHFKAFSKEPLAAASLAQVHTAVLKDGTEVVVKMQYPEARHRFRFDMWVMETALRMVMLVNPKFEFAFLAREFRRYIEQELDFRQEGGHCDDFRRMFADDERFVAPRVYWGLSSDRVLTMERMFGIKITDAAALKQAGIAPREVGSLLLHAYGRMTYEKGLVHCDPHPGNLLVRRSRAGAPQLVFLDHGLYVRLSREFRQAYADMWLGGFLRDSDRLTRAMEKLGIAQALREAGVSSVLTAVVTHQMDWRSMTAEQREELRRTLRFIMEGNQHVMSKVAHSMPPEMRLLMKVNNIVRGTVTQLGLSAEQLNITARYAMAAARDLDERNYWAANTVLAVLSGRSLAQAVAAHWRELAAVALCGVSAAALVYYKPDLLPG